MNALTPVNPGWKPNHLFTYPVVIIDANGTLIALDNVACWRIFTQHLDDSWRPRVPAQKEKANTPQEANNALHAWACALHTLGTPLPPWREKQKPLLPPSLNQDRQYRRVHNGASEGTPTRDLETAGSFVRHLQRRMKE
jgi:hypothetical protein